MKAIKTYISILTFVLAAIVAATGQNGILLHTKIDSTVIGFDIPVTITIKGTNTIDSFQLQVLGYKELLNIYAPEVDTTKNIPNTGITTEDIQKTDFEIRDPEGWKVSGSTLIPGNSKTNTVKLKIWDMGQFVILPVVISNNDTIYPNDPNIYPQISVFAGLNPKDTIKSIAPIKDIVKEEKNWKDYMWLYIAILALTLIVLAIIFLPKLFIRKKTAEQEKKVIIEIIPAHIIALEKLKKLKKEKIWKLGKDKGFQSQLTFILREYLENRFDIQALEQTTGEIVHSLQKIKMDTKDIDIIKNILQIADMVKFAKAKPGEDINEKFLDETTDFVLRTKQEEVKDNDGKH